MVNEKRNRKINWDLMSCTFTFWTDMSKICHQEICQCSLTRIQVWAMNLKVCVYFSRSATLLLMSWENAGFCIVRTWRRATTASTGDTSDAFWKLSECEFLLQARWHASLNLGKDIQECGGLGVCFIGSLPLISTCLNTYSLIKTDNLGY